MIYLYLFLEFFKVGLFTFGGGYAMIPLIKEVVLSHSWMDEAHFIDMIGLSEVTPGPIAINMATFIGSEQGGFLGSLVATIGVVLPAFLIMLLIRLIFQKASPIIVSIFGSLVHGLAQLLVGVFFLGTWSIFLYYPMMGLLLIVTGTLSGFVTLVIGKRIQGFLKK